MSAPVVVQERHDKVRGCGWRKEGGLYLVAGGAGVPCCKLPISLHVCPTCSGGIKFTRGWTWIDPVPLFPKGDCATPTLDFYKVCPLAAPERIGKMGLLWVGEKFYTSPADFNDEASRQGISRRVSTIPREFKVGKTWVAFAHIKAIPIPDQQLLCRHGIFRLFQPTAIEYVVTGKETQEELAAFVERGITPVRVVKDGSEFPTATDDEDES